MRTLCFIAGALIGPYNNCLACLRVYYLGAYKEASIDLTDVEGNGNRQGLHFSYKRMGPKHVTHSKAEKTDHKLRLSSFAGCLTLDLNMSVAPI